MLSWLSQLSRVGRCNSNGTGGGSNALRPVCANSSGILVRRPHRGTPPHMCPQHYISMAVANNISFSMSYHRCMRVGQGTLSGCLTSMFDGRVGVGRAMQTRRWLRGCRCKQGKHAEHHWPFLVLSAACLSSYLSFFSTCKQGCYASRTNDSFACSVFKHLTLSMLCYRAPGC